MANKRTLLHEIDALSPTLGDILIDWQDPAYGTHMVVLMSLPQSADVGSGAAINSGHCYRAFRMHTK